MSCTGFCVNLHSALSELWFNIPPSTRSYEDGNTVQYVVNKTGQTCGCFKADFMIHGLITVSFSSLISSLI